MDVNFASYLKVNAQKIDQELDQILSKLPPLAKEFVDSCGGGKRIRGVLCKLGYELGEGKKTNEIFKVGAALEILHTAILVHDDIMDKSPFRRGQPSLYKSVGIDQAIALGDLGFFLAIRIICQSSFPEKEKHQALKLFSQVMVDTAIGQIMDIQKADPMIVAKLKTAQYTIWGPLCVGAILAGGLGPTSPRLRGIKEFGESLGIAFQIRDDILDGEIDSVDNARLKALEYVIKAKSLIPDSLDDKFKDLLIQMADYLIERTK